jgi:transposase-like protein
MTEATIAFLEYLRNVGKEEDADFLREGIRVLTQALKELEVSQQIGAARYERSDERSSYRNGYRERTWQTRVGDVALQIPKVRDGSYFPSFLEPRRRPEQALLAVVQQAYIEGVSTRKVDDLVQSLGLSGMDKSAVSRICKQLDKVVETFRNRPLESDLPLCVVGCTVCQGAHEWTGGQPSSGDCQRGAAQRRARHSGCG